MEVVSPRWCRSGVGRVAQSTALLTPFLPFRGFLMGFLTSASCLLSVSLLLLCSLRSFMFSLLEGCSRCFRHANRLEGFLLRAKPWVLPSPHIVATSMGRKRPLIKLPVTCTLEAAVKGLLLDLVAGKVPLRKIRSNESHLKLAVVVGSCNPACQRLRQEDCQFEASLGYIARRV